MMAFFKRVRRFFWLAIACLLTSCGSLPTASHLTYHRVQTFPATQPSAKPASTITTDIDFTGPSGATTPLTVKLPDGSDMNSGHAQGVDQALAGMTHWTGVWGSIFLGAAFLMLLARLFGSSLPGIGFIANRISFTDIAIVGGAGAGLLFYPVFADRYSQYFLYAALAGVGYLAFRIFEEWHREKTKPKPKAAQPQKA